MNFKDGKIVQDSVQIDSIQFLKTKNYKEKYTMNIIFLTIKDINRMYKILNKKNYL